MSVGAATPYNLFRASKKPAGNNEAPGPDA